MPKTKSREEKVIIITILSIILVFSSSLIYPAISKKPEFRGKSVTSNGAIKSKNDVNIYWDQKGTQRVSGINWGSLTPGNEKTITLFVENNNKEPIFLDFIVSNWSPSEISNYLTLNWDYDGSIIGFKEKIQINFTLTVSEKITSEQNFNFDITIISIPDLT
ncbi:MAG: hypothetical protein P8Y18_10130 [Candidatus Bathyarchaeota archaeon]